MTAKSSLALGTACRNFLIVPEAACSDRIHAVSSGNESIDPMNRVTTNGLAEYWHPLTARVAFLTVLGLGNAQAGVAGGAQHPDPPRHTFFGRGFVGPW